MSKVGILLLSDLHVADDIYTNAEKSRFQDDGMYLYLLEREIKNIFQKVENRYLIVSGDFTQQGEPCEFEKVYQILKDLHEELNIDKQNILLVPGNHDFSWNKFADRLRKKKIKNRDEFYKEQELKLTEFKSFYNDFFENKKSFNANSAIIDSVRIPEIKCTFVALNSLYHESQLQQDHYGYIDPMALNKELISLDKAVDGDTKIAIMHHNPIIAGSEERKMRNWNDIIQIFRQHNFKAFLSGHAHVTAATTVQTKDTFSFVITGSIGKTDSDLTNSFVILQDAYKDNILGLNNTFYYCINEIGKAKKWQESTNDSDATDFIPLAF